MLAGVHRGLGVQLRVVRNRYPMVPQVLPLSDHRPWLTPGWHLLIATNATRHSSRRPIGAGQTRPIVLAPATHQDSTVGLASCPVAPGEAWGQQAQLFRALAEDRDPLNPGRCVALCVVVNVVWCRQRSLTGPPLAVHCSGWRAWWSHHCSPHQHRRLNQERRLGWWHGWWHGWWLGVPQPKRPGEAAQEGHVVHESRQRRAWRPAVTKCRTCQPRGPASQPRY